MSNYMGIDLIAVLKQVHTEKEEENYINKYVNKHDEEYFHQYLQAHIINKQLSIAEVMNNSRINKNYGYNIINGTRKNPGRDKVLALCIGAGMNFDQMQRALYLSKQPPLDPRDERDVRIVVAVNNRVKDVLKLNILLESKGVAPLDI